MWNTGEYIEGFSNPLWTMVMALSIFIFGQNLAPLIIQLLGLNLLLFSGFYIYSIVQILNKKFDNKNLIQSTNNKNFLFLSVTITLFSSLLVKRLFFI